MFGSRLFYKEKLYIHLPKNTAAETHIYQISIICRSLPWLYWHSVLAPRMFSQKLFQESFLKRERCFNSLIWFFFYWKAWGRNSDINGWEALIIPFNWEEPKPTIRSIANIRIPAHYLMTCIWPQTQESLEIDCWKSPEETFLQWGATRDTSLGVIVIRRVYKELQYSHEL